MRIDNHEFIAVQHIAAFHNLSPRIHAFTLPSIHADIPVASSSTSEEVDMATLLINAGIIDVQSVPDSASSAHQIMQFGIENWFRSHIAKLHVIDVEAEILPPSAVKDVIEDCGEDDYERNHRDFLGGFGMAVRGYDTFNPHIFGAKALSIELTHPGLFKAAMFAIHQAATITVPIRLPTDIYEMHQYFWEDFGCLKDANSIPKDDDVRETLEWNFGEGEAEVEQYLPSAIVTMLGGDIAIPALCKKSDRMLKREITKLSRSAKDIHAQAVAKSILKLNSAIAVAKKVDASLPTMDGLSGQTIEPGCTLLYRYDEAIYQTLNQNYENAMSGGYATNMVGMSEMPREVHALADFFMKLGKALKVLAALDDLLFLVTEPYIET
jgi:PRTRC genetic system protein F